jgi:hypothetical protein
MMVIRQSMISGKTNTMELDISEAQLARWQSGGLVQDVFPHLTDDEREFLMTGITKEEWDQHIKPLEEDDQP